jgi:hypothetical protein
MIVPRYWTEGRVKGRVGTGQVTVRRFGWSDASQNEAQVHADARAREAFARAAAGEKVARREPKLPYNGAEGVPIREEIVSRHGEAVVTRNAYGARCLNTPDVLFADVDFEAAPALRLKLAVLAMLLVGAVAVGWTTNSTLYGVLAGAAALILGGPVAAALHRSFARLAGGPETQARRRIEKFVAERPDWHLRVYRTPAGLRILAMHRTFDPGDPAVSECFQALGVDRIYARMCLNQRCFRARVSPKPWRIGIGTHLRPRPGVSPVDPARLPERARWIEAYEQAARGHASCRFVETFESRAGDPNAQAVQALHDELCRATGSLPIA